MRTTNLFAHAALLCAFAFSPFGSSALASALVDINTADAALLDTLPGIGPSRAAAIVAYRDAHGPFAAIEDIQNVSGIKESVYAGLAAFITIGNAGAATGTSDASASSTASAAQDTRTSTGASTYVPPSAVLTVDAGPDRNAVLEAPLHLSASVKAKGGAPDSSAQITWSFGDGSSSTGSSVDKTYRYAGTYLVTVTATNGLASAEDEFTVVAKPALVRILAATGDGITIANDASERLDLSGWRLSVDTGFFRIPSGTILLPHANVLFPSNITNVPIALSATLSYPDGVVAARYSFPQSASIAVSVQPFPSAASSTGEQTVEHPYGYDATSSEADISISGTAHEATAVSAPAAATELAAAGAAFATATTSDALPEKSHAANPFLSPWMLGFLGVMALAGGAFILL